MTGKWLVCLSLLVVADAASLGPKTIEIPVQVVYDEAPQKAIDAIPSSGAFTNLKNLEEKPQLSIEETVEQKVLNIPIAIAKIAENTVKDVLQQAEEKIEDNVSSSSSEDNSSSEEAIDHSSNELKSNEDSREDESNEIHNDILQPVEEIIVSAAPAVPVVPVDLPVIQNEMVEPIMSDAVQSEPSEQAVVMEIKEPEQIVLTVNEANQPIEQPEEIMIAQEDALVENVKIIEEIKEEIPSNVLVQAEPEKIIIEAVVSEEHPVEDLVSEPIVPEMPETVQEVSGIEQLRVANPDPEANPKQDAAASQNAVPPSAPTTAAPFRPLAGLQSAINRLGENIGNVINSIRPSNNNNNNNNEASTTKASIVAPVEESNPVDSPVKADMPAPENPASAAPPNNFVGTLQSNINNQLANLGNRVNSFIDNLRPKAPVTDAQNEEETTPPNTPFINNMQQQFNNGLQGLTTTVNNAFGFLNPNGQNVTKEDENGQQQNQNQFPAVQQILNGVTSFQQNFQNFIQGNQQTQQSDESSPSNSTNVGQQVLQMVTSNIQNIFQSFNKPNNGTQSDETTQNQNPLSGIQNIFSNIGNQFNNLISGAQQNNTVVQNIPTQIPGVSQLQIPGASNIPQLPGVPQIPGIDNLAAQIPNAPQLPAIPGAEQFQQGLSQIPGASQLPAIPGVEQFQQGLSQIPGASQLPAIPGADQIQQGLSQIPGVAQLPQFPQIPGVPSIPSPAAPSDSTASTTTTTTAMPAAA